MQKFDCFVFSDLHINSRGSRYDEIAPRLMEEIAKSDIIVLNGDVVEMFYPKHLKQERRVYNAYIEASSDAGKWLKDLTEAYPSKQFFYLEGNHENCDKFREQIYKLRKSPPFGESNLIWGRSYMQIGNGDFFHGDNEMRNKDFTKRERGQLEDIISGNLHESINHSMEMPVMWAMRVINSDNKVVNKIHKFIKNVSPERLENSEHMFFGHTHLPILAMEKFGRQWHNTGSATEYGADNFLRFELSVPEECEFRTENKRVFYPGATIENVRRVDMGGKFSTALDNKNVAETSMTR